MHIRKGDQVEVISGKDRGKRGRVLAMNRAKRTAIVEGVSMIKKHAKPNPQRGIQGGIIEREAPIHISNLLPIDPDTNAATRVGYKFLESADGRRRKVRVARRSGAELDR
ncbi:MAG: 50S ribosomal protein L24 [Acidobacteriota bacterium]|nr:50S ribosomal protein L24 [Acidobacteriota bacterium]